MASRNDSSKNSTNTLNLLLLYSVRFLFQFRIEFIPKFLRSTFNIRLYTFSFFFHPFRSRKLRESLLSVDQWRLGGKSGDVHFSLPGTSFYTRCPVHIESLGWSIIVTNWRRRNGGCRGSIDRSIVITFVTTPRFKWDDNLAQQAAVAVYISFTIAEMEFMGLISEVE